MITRYYPVTYTRLFSTTVVHQRAVESVRVSAGRGCEHYQLRRVDLLEATPRDMESHMLPLVTRQSPLYPEQHERVSHQQDSSCQGDDGRSYGEDPIEVRS